MISFKGLFDQWYPTKERLFNARGLEGQDVRLAGCEKNGNYHILDPAMKEN
jgi:hypothetical protein